MSSIKNYNYLSDLGVPDFELDRIKNLDKDPRGNICEYINEHGEISCFYRDSKKPDFNELEELTNTPDWYFDYMKQVDNLVDQIDRAISHIWYEQCLAHGLKTFDMFVGYIRYNIADVSKLFDSINNDIHTGIGKHFESYKTFNLCFPNAEQKQTFLSDSNLTKLRAFWDRIEEENKEMCRRVNNERDSI